MKKTTLLLMIMGTLSGILGFGREMILSYFYGASEISDAYIVSITIPILIFGFVGAGITAGYIPMYNKIENKEGLKEANTFTNNLITLLLVIFTIIIMGIFLFTEEVVKIFASGFNGETLNLTIKLTKISIFAIYFNAIVVVYNSFLQMKGNYLIPSFVGFPLNIITIVFIYLSTFTYIELLAFGTLIAAASQLLLLYPFVLKAKYKYKVKMKYDQNMKDMFKIAFPSILGIAAYQINILIDRTMASNLEIGGISALNYSFRFISFVQGILVLSIITVLYTTISKYAAKKEMTNFKMATSESIRLVIILIVPATFGIAIFSNEIIDILFGRGAFNEYAINLTSNALFFYSIGLIGFGLRDVLSRIFYSLQDSKTPTINAAFSVVLNIILNIILSRYMGIAGLALATSISAIFCTLLLFMSLYKKIGNIGLKKIIVTFINALIASLLMVFVVKQIFFLTTNWFPDIASFMLSVISGMLIYILLLLLQNNDDIKLILKIIIKKLNKSLNSNGI